MGKRCYICGVLGFGECLIKCSNCKSAFIHLYCGKVVQFDIPDDWVCENCCESKNTACKFTDEVPVRKRSVKFIPTNEAVVLAASQSWLSKGPVRTHTPSPFSKRSPEMQSSRERTVHAHNASAKWKRDISQGDHPCKDNLNASKRGGEQKLSDGQLIMMDRFLPNHPAELVTWKGSLRTGGFAPPISSYDDVWGYPPAKVGRKAFEFAKKMPDDLDLKAIPRSTVWASMFRDKGPDEHDIGLYFLPNSNISDQYYSRLVAHFEKKDMVLESYIHGIQLLIFSSSCLEGPSKKINQAYYLWGLFVPSAITFMEPEVQQLPLKTNAETAVQYILKNEETADMEIDMRGGAAATRDSYCSCSETSKAAFSASQPGLKVQVKPEKRNEDDLAGPPPGFPAHVAQVLGEDEEEETGMLKYKKMDELLQSGDENQFNPTFAKQRSKRHRSAVPEPCSKKRCSFGKSISAPVSAQVILHDPDHIKRYKHLMSREICNTKYLDENMLNALGVREDVEWMANQVGWTQFLTMKEPTYTSLTREFLSTVTVNITQRQPYTEGIITFRLQNQDRELTMEQFNSIFGFRNGGSRKRPNEYRPDEFWSEISSEQHFDGRGRASIIYNPCFRIMHRLMANTIFGRGQGKSHVQSDELMHLWAMVQKNYMNVDTGSFLALHLQNVGRATRVGKIVIGGLITSIARYLDVNTDGLDQASGHDKIDLDMLKQMQMIISNDGRYFLRLQEIDKSLPLPDPTSTTIRVRKNWKRTFLL